MPEIIEFLHFVSILGAVGFSGYKIVCKSLKKGWKRVNVEIDIRIHYKKK